MLWKHAEIEDAVVCGVEDSAILNENPSASQRVRVYVVKTEKSDLKEHDVVSFLKQSDPSLPVIDGGVFFIDRVPKTSVFILLHELRNEQPL